MCKQARVPLIMISFTLAAALMIRKKQQEGGLKCIFPGNGFKSWKIHCDGSPNQQRSLSYYTQTQPHLDKWPIKIPFTHIGPTVCTVYAVSNRRWLKVSSLCICKIKHWSSSEKGLFYMLNIYMFLLLIGAQWGRARLLIDNRKADSIYQVLSIRMATYKHCWV